MKQLLLMLLMLAAPAAAQDLPALYDVTGVASDDALNVRSGPGTEFDVIGTLAPGATGVEAVAADPDSGWLQVSMGEMSGWASPAFLTRTGPDWDAGLPASYTCSGTEPFWSLVTGPGEANLGGPAFTVLLRPSWSGTAAGRLPYEFGAIWTSGSRMGLSGVIRREECSDGMSDRVYGMSVVLIRHDTPAPQALSGCCTLAQ
ncbi:SH3 domain-containing protein [Rhodobacterales bacterium HKCCE3408]|nr:SH3 domain-containing protein [Rhodobacterales bacterium HKCCE3408]